MPISNQQIKEMNLVPLVKVPDYSEADIDVEHLRLIEIHKQEVLDWFKNVYSMLVLCSLIITCVLLYFFPTVLSWMGLSDDLSKAGFDIKGYLPLYLLVVPLLPLPLCPIPDWYKMPGRDEAEFDLRAKLTKSQLENASEDKIRQIFAYCNSALVNPFTSLDK